MTTTATSMTTKTGVCVGSVPLVVGLTRLAASDPATASTGTMIQNRLNHIASPSAML